MEKHIFHVDVNSAFLSWNALWEIRQGMDRDLRTIPACVGGDPKSRRGIVLAKSSLAKACGVITGEPLYAALGKCPDLVVVPPQREEYKRASQALVEVLKTFTPRLEQFSVDECFLDMGPLSRPDAWQKAQAIRQRVHADLGFTVNVGIGLNRFCAKMASDFRKPNQCHSLYPEEIASKLHPLPIEDLYMVGPALAKKLRNINIKTIGDLARCDGRFIADRFGKWGRLVYGYSQGQGDDTISPQPAKAKGVGNSTTLPQDVTDRQEAKRIIAKLLETTVPRLKKTGDLAFTMTVHFTTADFTSKSKSRSLAQATDQYGEILSVCKELFDELWQGQPLRKIGVALSRLTDGQAVQLSLLDLADRQKQDRLDQVMEELQNRFGKDLLHRGKDT